MRPAQRLRGGARIVATIAAKDIADAIKNKIILSILLGVAVLALSAMAFPLIVGLNAKPRAVVYDPGRSTLIRALALRPEFALIVMDTQAEMEDAVAESPMADLGLVIPPGFRQAEGSGGVVVLEGYVAHWVDPGEVAGRVAFFEEQLSAASWQTVRIDVADRRVYPPLDAGGQPFLASTSMAVLILVLGLAVVPHLLIEEKEARTFDALLVSPARLGQVVAGKALAGACYCLVGAAVAFLVYAKWYVHWELAIAAVLLGTAFAVGIGLALGAWFDNAAAMGLWASALVLLLVIPASLGGFDTGGWPEALRFAGDWLPSAALMRLLRFSMAGDLAAAPIWTNLAVLIIGALPGYALLAWRVRRADR